VADFLSELESRARRRFVRWDPSLWRAVCDGPAQQLSAALLATGGDEAQSRALAETYLQLACEGIGLGYLFPPSAGTENVFSLFWNRILPERLVRAPASLRAELLAQSWNLCENLEASPLWLRRIFHRALRDLPSLEKLPETAAHIEALAAEAPRKKLDAVRDLTWIHLGAEDKRFLPGAVHFLAPRVVCVHDRERSAAGGRDAVTFGVWLDSPPLLLGPMGCREEVAPVAIPDAHLEAAASLDARFTDVHDAALEPHAIAATLASSQFVVVLGP